MYRIKSLYDNIMEIKQAGDRVRIMLPNPEQIKIVRGNVCPTPQGVPPEALDLVIDKTQAFSIAITDVELAQTNFKNWLEGMATAVGQNLALDRAKEVMQAIFEYAGKSEADVYDHTNHPMAGEFGTDAVPLELTPTGVYQLVLQVKMALLNSGAIDADGTYDVAPMQKEGVENRGVFICGTKLLAMLLQAYQLSFRTGQMADIVVKDGVVTRVAGLDVFVDRAIDSIYTTAGTGATMPVGEQQGGTDATRKAFVNLPFIAGTKNAITKASQISKTETIRDPYCMQTNLRGLELYGFKILHPEALVRGVVKAPADLYDPAFAAIPVAVQNTTEAPVNTKEVGAK